MAFVLGPSSSPVPGAHGGGGGPLPCDLSLHARLWLCSGLPALPCKLLSLVLPGEQGFLSRNGEPYPFSPRRNSGSQSDGDGKPGLWGQGRSGTEHTWAQTWGWKGELQGSRWCSGRK